MNLKFKPAPFMICGDDEMKVVGKYFAKHFACIGHERVKLIFFFYLYIPR